MSTVQEVVDLYLTQRPGIVSASAWKEACRLLDQFAAEHGTKDLSVCVPFILAAWVSSHPEWSSDWTRSRVARTLQRPFNWAAKLGAIQRNPFAGFSLPGGSPGRAMTDDEFAVAIRNAGLPFRRILRFLRYTGARPCEARELQWPFVNPEQCTATYLRHKTVRSRRDHAPRVLMLGPEVLDLLIEILAEEMPGEFVFLNHRGNPWTKNAFGLQLHRLRHRSGLANDCRLYGLRHRFGTLAAESGLDLKAISELMGHTTTRMTEHYIHVSGKVSYLKAALGKVEGL